MKIAKNEFVDSDKAVLNSQALFVFVQGFGETFGMLVGPLITSEMGGFRFQCDFFAFFTLCIALIYLISFKPSCSPLKQGWNAKD